MQHLCNFDMGQLETLVAIAQELEQGIPEPKGWQFKSCSIQLHPSLCP